MELASASVIVAVGTHACGCDCHTPGVKGRMLVATPFLLLKRSRYPTSLAEPCPMMVMSLMEDDIGRFGVPSSGTCPISVKEDTVASR